MENTILHRELPLSSYEVIHLPTQNSKKHPVNKGLREHQRGAKRQKATPSITTQADESVGKKSTPNAKCPSFTKTLVKSKGLHVHRPRIKRQKITPLITNQADGICSTPNANCPSFTKTLVRSHVSGCFWMGLPQPFCRMHLPIVDTYFILEYENGKQYAVKYLADRTAFSGRWRKFSLAEKLAEGDTLEFQLVTPTKFKVHKVNDNSGLGEVNGVCATLTLDAGVERSGSDGNNDLKKTDQASSPEAVSRDKDHEMIPSEEDGDDIVQNVENVKKNTPECNSGGSKHPQRPSIVGDYDGITNFDDFVIILDKLLKKDFNLLHDIKRSYYKLCSSQKSILHVNLLKDINPVMIAGCIIETVDIANAMKSCELPNFDNDFAIWDRKLKSLEALGMGVSFLSARLLYLQRIFHDSDFAKKKQRYMALSSEHADTENTIKRLQEQLDELTRVSEKRADDIKKLETVINEHGQRFQEQVSAPW